MPADSLHVLPISLLKYLFFLFGPRLPARLPAPRCLMLDGIAPFLGASIASSTNFTPSRIQSTPRTRGIAGGLELGFLASYSLLHGSLVMRACHCALTTLLSSLVYGRERLREVMVVGGDPFYRHEEDATRVPDEGLDLPWLVAANRAALADMVDP